MTALEYPLDDITVVELGHIIAGPYCSMLLADLGAEVIKVEHPKYSDAFRGASEGASSAFNYVNRNKRGVTLDLKDEEGKAAFYDLIAEADVLVENYSPGTTENLGVDYDSLVEVNPELVYCSVKGFNEGPYENRPALDPVAEALSGLMSTTGYPDHPPARCGASVADMAASLQGAIGVVGALRQRDHTGEGQHLTAPMFESTVGLIGNAITFSDTYGEKMGKWRGGGQGQWAPYGVFETDEDDTWVFIGPSSEKHWDALCETMGMDEMAEDPRFETLPDRRENREALDEKLTEIFRNYSREEILERTADSDVPVAPVHNTLEVVDDEHLNATGHLVDVKTVQEEDTYAKVPVSPLRSTGYDVVQPEDPPGQGEHTADVLESIGYSAEDIERLEERGAI